MQVGIGRFWKTEYDDDILQDCDVQRMSHFGWILEIDD